MPRRPKYPLWLFLLLAPTPEAISQMPSFEETVVDSQYLTNPWGKAVGDLDGDGFADLAATTAYNLAIYWYRYPGWTRHVLGDRNGGDDLQIADMDGDGDQDVVSNGGTILWHRNPSREGGDATRPWPIHSVWSGGRSHDIALGDVDGNGRLDVLIRREMGPTWLIFQTGADLWTPIHLSQAPNGTGSALADLDGDGRIDVVENGFWLGQPADPLKAAWIRHDFAAWGPNSAVAVADIDRDGHRDVFLSESYVASRLSWFKAPADAKAGGWEERLVARPADMIHRFHLADMDRDDRLDIVFAEQHQSAGHRVGILRNADGAGGSWDLRVISTAGSHNIALGDVGGDGDLDIFGVNWRVDTRPRLWINGGGGSPPDTQPPVLPPPVGLTAAVGNGQVTLDWAPVPGAAGYHLYWREGTAVDKADGTRIGGALPPTVVERLRNGVAHAFAVSAFDPDRESDLGPVVTATPRAPDTAPDPPDPPDPPPGIHGTPFRGAPATLPGTLEAEDFDLGAEGAAFHDVDVANQGGQYRAGGVDIGHARDTGAGYYVGWIGTGEWLEYTVRVARAGAYRLEARLASPFQGRGFRIEWNGRDVSGPVRAPFTDGWHAWRTQAVDLSLPDTGVGMLRVHVDTQGFNLNWLRFVPKDGGGPLPDPPPPVPPPSPGTGEGDSVQAEDATLGGVLKSSFHAGHTGTGYVDYLNASGDFVEWTLRSGGAGSVVLRIRYANADTRSRPLDLYVDGALHRQGLPFPPTGTWTTWAETAVTLSLPEGERRIRLQAAGFSGPNVDGMRWAPP